MKTVQEIVFSKKIRNLYRQILSNHDGLPAHQKEIKENSYLIRNCCINILNAATEYVICTKTETGSSLLFEDINDFAELTSYYFTKKNITEFLRNLSENRNLTYGEIACLIPVLEWNCLAELKKRLKKKEGKIEGIIRSLHVLDGYDCSSLADTLSRTEDVLKQDEIYPHLDKESKNLYRQKLRELAKKQKKNERDTAVELLKAARKEKKQIGEILLLKKPNKIYFPTLFILCGSVFVAVGFLTKSPGTTFLSIVPALLTGKLICDTIVSQIVKSEILPKIKIKKDNCPQTLVTIVSMISDKDDAKKMLHRLDVLSHRISIPSIRLGLLLDLPGSPVEYSDDDRELVEYLSTEIKNRNQTCNRYFCAVRKRVWSSETFRFEAYGRKQGAMMDFASLTSENKDKFTLLEGNLEGEYMITLDSDTEPTIGAVESLIGFMEHPNHKAEIGQDSNGFFRVVKGYGIAAPRVEANPETSFSTPFSAMLSGNCGTEFYKNPHFNLYQDLLQRGIFCGKGIVRLSLYRDLIAKRFYQDPLLSHDLPEGEILRCANLSDTVFFDEIPETIPADEKRSHRWIRGDLQNGIFLSSKENHCNIFRFKLLHNVCRAWFPISCFFLIVFSLFTGINGLLAALIWLIFPFILRLPFLCSAAFGKIKKLHPFREFSDAVLETVLNILLLPTRAYNGLDGTVRGIVRSFRKKNKLEWTTAAATSNGGVEISDYYYQLRWQLIGFFLLFFPQTVFLGGLWIITPVIARQLSQQYKKDTAQGEELHHELRSMWNYYEDFMNEKHHFLPPDNYQQEPLNIVASRTSPTNIGLSILALLGAFDLNFINENELCQRIDNTLKTIEVLPKWKGHLYNWYDTETLKILNPRFVSTVDSGNFAAALLTLSKGLLQQKTNRCTELANRIRKILDAMDFSALYDDKKKLFSIGFSEEENRLSESYYDLYASEARLTSYYAIMMHQIPWEHWAQLSRPAEKVRGDFILSSWSGTMFEYFMPHLFLPAYRRTLSGETLRGILSAQMKNNDPRIPWGISESCYYKFDSLGNYQYRAFGIFPAAVRKDLSFPKIVSPYSTFLAYPWFPVQAEQNKKRLPKGKYGYFEAVDYRAGPENPRVVQCYMAHHLSMSFLAGVNVLCDQIMQKRFMKEEGEAFISLLTEKLPPCSKNYLPSQGQDRERWYPSEIRIDRPDPEHPKVKLLSNGCLTELLTDSGSGFIKTLDRNLTKQDPNPNSPTGVYFFVRNKGTVFGATYAPLYSNHNYRMFFDLSGAVCYGTFPEFESRLTVTMHPELPVSIRELTLKNNLMTENDFDFFISAEPTLCKQEDYFAHPEYKDLFLTAEYDAEQRILSFCRNDEEKGECWISITVSTPFQFQVSKDRLPTPTEFADCKKTIHPIFPILSLSGKLNLRGRGTESVRFYLATADTKEKSFEYLKECVRQNIQTIQRRFSQTTESLFISADIQAADRMIFDRVLPSIAFPWRQSGQEYKRPNNLSVRYLWKFGISADHPILTVRLPANDTVNCVFPFIKAMFLLNHAGVKCDLILLYREEEEYQTPQKTALDSLLSELEEPIRAQIFPINTHSVEEYQLIQKCSNFFVNLDRGWKWKHPNRTFRPILQGGTPISHSKITFPLAGGGYTKDTSYVVSKQDKQLGRPWSLVLANHRIGTVLNERSLGFTFADNASENQITPRNTHGEFLYAVIHGKKYDLLRNSSVEFFQNRAVYQLDLFGNEITTEVAVLPNLPAKTIRVAVKNKTAALTEIVYQPQITLGKRGANTVQRFVEDDKFFHSNKGNHFYGNGYCVLFGHHSQPKQGSLSFHPTDQQTEETFVLAYAYGIQSARTVAGILTEERIKKELKGLKTKNQRFLTIDTPDQELNVFVNGFLQQQILYSRILGRTGPSQPGGAYGFRDQLQDSVCLATFKSSYLKRQILRCCAHQFEEGDVMHWWHPRPYHADDGIKTRFSDDPFWLIFACTQYYKITNKGEFFEKKIPYLDATPLSSSERDRYFAPPKSKLKESIYQHCVRALRFGLKIGDHGLILMGAGDWNDGMNRVESGAETVWGSMFALLCLESFLPLAERFGTEIEWSEIKTAIQSLREALENHAFSENRFIRGLRKDSTLFGGDGFIDLLPQAFSVFCKMDNEKIDTALSTAYERLWDKKYKIIKLLDPPYRKQEDSFPGSIADYPPGVRENGGQYTHAGVWFAKALYEQGSHDEGYEILSGINPVNHNKTKKDLKQYGAEPYVIAADVYSLPGREGFAGWTHYTGAAGWYLKTVTESLLGIQREGKFVTIKPHIPKEWNGYKATIQIENDTLEILAERGTEVGMFEKNQRIPFVELNGTTHKITVIL